MPPLPADLPPPAQSPSEADAVSSTAVATPVGPPAPAMPAWLWGALLVAWFGGLIASLGAALGWIDGLDGTYAMTQVVWLAFFPLFAGIQGRLPTRSAVATTSTPARHLGTTTVGMEYLLIVALSWSVVACVGWRDEALPPAYHDEYSYLLQAETFLQGHWVAPPAPVHPELFHQMHVLDVHSRASRYYPGYSLTLVPAFALGHPLWANWELYGLSVLLTACLAEQFVPAQWRRFARWLTAGLCWTSPALLVFHQLLLAHATTLTGCLLFLVARQRAEQGGSRVWMLIASAGLSWAMLSRPATAAAIGLPYGIALLVHWAKGLFSTRPLVVRRVASEAIAWLLPLACGWALMLAYNHAATGSFATSPYQLYTQRFTPRHVYGFNNVLRGAAAGGDAVLEAYDRWAVNLTWPLALQNVAVRLLASWLWGYDLTLLAMLAAGGVVAWLWLPLNARLLVTAIVCLHLIHLPYWYEGIMHFHYVYESISLWLALLTVAIVEIIRRTRRDGRRLLALWLLTGVLLAAAGNGLSFGAWEARLGVASATTRVPRLAHAELRRTFERFSAGRPTVVLVRVDAAAVHLDPVVNHSDWDGPLWIARVPQDFSLAGGDQLQQLAAEFGDRRVLFFDQATNRMTVVQP